MNAESLGVRTADRAWSLYVGCNAAFVSLLRQVRPELEDQIVFLGDYFDRGPASRAVIDSLLKLSKTCSAVFLRGKSRGDDA